VKYCAKQAPARSIKGLFATTILLFCCYRTTIPLYPRGGTLLQALSYLLLAYFSLLHQNPDKCWATGGRWGYGQGTASLRHRAPNQCLKFTKSTYSEEQIFSNQSHMALGHTETNLRPQVFRTRRTSAHYLA